MRVEDSKQTVRRSIEAVWVNHDLAALPTFWTSDCVNHAMPTGADNRGLDVLRAYHAGFFEALTAFADIKIDVVQQVGEADRVVTHLMTHLRHTGAFQGIAATGKSVTLASIRIDRFHEGKIAEHWSVADMAGLMQQLQA